MAHCCKLLQKACTKKQDLDMEETFSRTGNLCIFSPSSSVSERQLYSKSSQACMQHCCKLLQPAHTHVCLLQLIGLSADSCHAQHSVVSFVYPLTCCCKLQSTCTTTCPHAMVPAGRFLCCLGVPPHAHCVCIH